MAATSLVSFLTDRLAEPSSCAQQSGEDPCLSG